MLAFHALVITAVFAALFTVGPLVGGPALYAAMGGSGAALDAALDYSNIVFWGAGVVWLLNGLASILRGSGQMLVPSAVMVLGEVLHVMLAPLLIFGLGPVPALGPGGCCRAGDDATDPRPGAGGLHRHVAGAWSGRACTGHA